MSQPAGGFKPGAPVQSPKPDWVNWFEQRLGWTEFDHDKELSRGWRLTSDCKSFRTVVGEEHAWCGMSLATALDDNGWQYPEECEAAIAYAKYGVKVAPETLYAIAVIEHASGKHHVAIWMGDRMILGGNQDNKICVKKMADSDRVIAWRWPIRK